MYLCCTHNYHRNNAFSVRRPGATFCRDNCNAYSRELLFFSLLVWDAFAVVVVFVVAAAAAVAAALGLVAQVVHLVQTKRRTSADHPKREGAIPR